MSGQQGETSSTWTHRKETTGPTELKVCSHVKGVSICYSLARFTLTHLDELLLGEVEREVAN